MTYNENDTAIILPARLASVRLPRKVLAKIGDKTMLQWTASKAARVLNSDMYIACDSDELAHHIKSWGYSCIITDPTLPSGTDRVYEALRNLHEEQNKKYKYVVNVQCDMPFVKPETISTVISALKSTDTDIMTPIAPLNNKEEFNNPNIVKAIVSLNQSKALYFTRSPAPHDGLSAGIAYKHIGIYAFRAESLEKFVMLPQSQLEIAERLEQLRALENGMSIGVKIVEDYALSVDNEDDLINARNVLAMECQLPT